MYFSLKTFIGKYAIIQYKNNAKDEMNLGECHQKWSVTDLRESLKYNFLAAITLQLLVAFIDIHYEGPIELLVSVIYP